MGNYVYASMQWARALHFPPLPFRLNSALPDTGIFGIHLLNLFWISTAASGSRTGNLIYLLRLYRFEICCCRWKLPQYILCLVAADSVLPPEEQSQLAEPGLQQPARCNPPVLLLRVSASRRSTRVFPGWGAFDVGADAEARETRMD